MRFRMLVWKDFQHLLRLRVLAWACGITWLLMLTAGWLSWYQYRQAVTVRKDANHIFRQQWEQQQRNPHAAAHFGTYVFKPVTPGSFFDQGLNDYSGTTFRIEAHLLHEVSFINADAQDAGGRIGKLSLAMILQVIVPLLVIVMAAPTVTAERQGGTFRLLLLQGIPPGTLLWAKTTAIYLAVTGMVLPCWLFLLAAGATLQLLPVVAVSIAVYQLYYLFIVLTGICISSYSNTTATAYGIMLAGWLIAVMLMPRMAATRIGDTVPVLSRGIFEDSVKQGYLKGLGNDGPYYVRAQKLTDKTLQQYGVSSVDKLPFNMEGLSFQEGEVYKQRVYNYFYQPVKEAFSRQQYQLDMVSGLNPYMIVRRISRMLAGTSIEYHDAFRTQAMAYRTAFIRTLNMALTQHPDIAGRRFFRDMPPFEMTPPDKQQLRSTLQNAMLALSLWTLLAALLLCFTASSKRLHL